MTSRPCEQCGYDLAGTSNGSTCPECGAVENPYFEQLSGQYPRVRQARVWLLRSLWAVSAAALIYLRLITIGARPGGVPPDPDVVFPALGSVGLVPAFLFFAGCWSLAVHLDDHGHLLRRLLRISCVLAFVMLCAVAAQRTG